MPAKPVTRVPIDTQWFTNAMAAVKLSQNEVAARMGMDRGAFSKTMRGLRRIQVAEIKPLAFVLQQTEEEVYRRSGAIGAIAPARLPAAVANRGTIQWPSGDVSFTGGAPTGRFSLNVVGGLLDGADVVCQPGDESVLTSDAVRMGIVVLKDGRVLFRKFRKSFAKGRFDLAEVFEFGAREDDCEIAKVFEVVGMTGLGA